MDAFEFELYRKGNDYRRELREMSAASTYDKRDKLIRDGVLGLNDHRDISEYFK